jgi:hypothetical protein
VERAKAEKRVKVEQITKRELCVASLLLATKVKTDILPTRTPFSRVKIIN